MHYARRFLVMLALAGFAPAPFAADEPVPGIAAPAAAAARKPPERMELDPTAIRGNQELPKVLYIVPWKDPGLAQPAGRPLNSLVDEALAPVDRDVFRRQMRYFDQLYAGAEEGPGAVAPPAPRD